VRVALTSNGNAFSTLMLRPLFEAPDVEVAGAVLVRVPPGEGGRVGRLWKLARRTGVRYAAHKLATLAGPAFYGTLTRTPVFLDLLCRRHGVPSVSVDTTNGTRAVRFLHVLEPDVLLSVSTPERLDPEVLAIPRVAALNVHWALLPRYAGIAPYFWVLRNGEERTGLTVHVMERDLDVGPILRRREVGIRPDDTMLSLQLRLARAGGEELLAVIAGMPGTLEDAREQDLSARSYFTWPSASDVRVLRASGRRLARLADYRELARLIKE
jgi:folate-dependent phosphoribosylglycinamide formyltransferase PurN